MDDLKQFNMIIKRKASSIFIPSVCEEEAKRRKLKMMRKNNLC